MRVKNKSDLSEFPAGRATLVRRYSPALTRRQLDLLAFCNYETPRLLTHGSYMRARELVRMGLLERHPGNTSVFRCTEAGTDVVNRWRVTGFFTGYECDDA